MLEKTAVRYSSNPSAGTKVINDPSKKSVPAAKFVNTTEIELTSVSQEEIYEFVDNEAYSYETVYT